LPISTYTTAAQTATVAYRRLALTPLPAGGEQVIAKNVEHRRHPVAPGDLLPLGVGAAAVGDGQLPDARARLRQPRRQLDLDPEPLRRAPHPCRGSSGGGAPAARVPSPPTRRGWCRCHRSTRRSRRSLRLAAEPA